MSVSVPSPNEDIVREGWIFKRGEYIKTWRRRYFVLRKDGTLLGYKTQPDGSSIEPCNNFTIARCQIMSIDQNRMYIFIIRGLQCTTVIERMFYVESEEERSEWIDVVRSVANNLAEIEQQKDLDNVEMAEIAEEALLDEKFSHQGISTDKCNGRKKITLENFEFLKVLGNGSYGKVILCREKSSSKLYAIKILKKEIIIQKSEVEHTMAERRVLQKTNHPFLISLKYSFRTNDRLCFVMQYFNGGDLYFHLKLKKVFDEDRARFYGAEIVSALGYLHSHNIIYRDVKLENILLDKDGHIVIADFGLCKEDISYDKKTNTFCGTPEYLAPEMLEDGDYGKAIDWWAVGVVLYEMICGRLPFSNRGHKTLFQQIRTDDIKFPYSISNEARTLLSGLLKKDPKTRLGGGPEDAKEIMAHSFFSQINWTDLVNKKIAPPFVPQISSDTDTHYFDSEFTGQSVELTPPDDCNLLMNMASDEHNFSQFSYQTISVSTTSSA